MMSLKRRRKHEERDEAKKRHKAVKGKSFVRISSFSYVQHSHLPFFPMLLILLRTLEP
ncbi:unnamed protein product [Toxocara canis]|uniref:Uncharacterized protein n=1 Tax=Toxocara canis TaxID=6265 RepID=A0A183U9E5_TOXCA|nr:unnamed protein product [Toxocara canis]